MRQKEMCLITCFLAFFTIIFASFSDCKAATTDLLKIEEDSTPLRYSKYPGSAYRIVSLCKSVAPIIQNDPAIRKEVPPRKVAIMGSPGILPPRCVHDSFSDPEPPAELQINGDVMIVGDIHGDLLSLSICLSKFELSPTLKILFLGDYVDRGPYGLEVISLLFELKIKHPDRIFLLRGNHENLGLNGQFGFATECMQKYARRQDEVLKDLMKDSSMCSPYCLQNMLATRPVDFAMLCSPKGVKVYEAVTSIWDILPKRAVINGKFFCVHGGIPEHFEDMDNLASEHFINIEEELLWNDPIVGKESETVDFLPNKLRGGNAKLFGKKAVSDFIKWKREECPDISYIVRAHETKEKPDELDNVFTIFSSRYYCNPQPFNANIMNINADGTYNFESLFDLEINHFSVILMSLLKTFGPELIEDLRSVKLLPTLGQLQNFNLYENSTVVLFLDLMAHLDIKVSFEFIDAFIKLKEYFPMLRPLLNDLEAYENYLDFHGFEELKADLPPLIHLPDEEFDQIIDSWETGSIASLNVKRGSTLPPEGLFSAISEPLIPQIPSVGSMLSNLNIYASPIDSTIAVQNPKKELDPIMMKIGLHIPSFRELRGYSRVLLHLLYQFEEAFPDEVDGPELIPESDDLDVLAKFLKKLSEVSKTEEKK